MISLNARKRVETHYNRSKEKQKKSRSSEMLAKISLLSRQNSGVVPMPAQLFLHQLSRQGQRLSSVGNNNEVEVCYTDQRLLGEHLSCL